MTRKLNFPCNLFYKKWNLMYNTTFFKGPAKIKIYATLIKLLLSTIILIKLYMKPLLSALSLQAAAVLSAQFPYFCNVTIALSMAQHIFLLTQILNCLYKLFIFG